MDVEEMPLMRGPLASPRRARRLVYLFFTLFVATLITTIVFSVLYAKEKKTVEKEAANNGGSTPGYDRSNDFPLRPQGPWNISENHPRSISFTTTEGTWLNLDVSPDGQTIAFEMLGDIYTLPIGGGQAQLLRGGVPFEGQPRYSPDGTKLMFTSDQSGCDNVWVMDLATKAETQVTFENYHFVSNAFWIDGKSMVANKWFTSTRSIAAGEIWTYPIDNTLKSNPGRQLVGRSPIESQVGVEEPVPSVQNGKTVIYYSRNVMDGSTWNYNKDPHQTVYAIYKFDTSTNKSSSVANEAGGSARPIISHSGNQMAFIRRTLFQTSLVIQDLTSGNDVIINDNLDFDQQESSAPCGVYPGFAFTPDDSAIVIWAKGNFFSINVASGIATQIPFSVDVNLQISPTVRFPHTVSDGSSFATKVVQYPAISADKKTFAFTSLATTYTYSPGSGTSPAPIYTPIDGIFQFWPHFSQDGKYLIHILWNDQTFSTVEVVTIADGTKYTVPTPIGRYYQPRFSPSNDAITYVKQGSDSLSGSTYSSNTGIYMHSMNVGANGNISFGIQTLVSSTGYSAAYSTGNSVFIQSGSYPLNLTEISTAQNQLGNTISNLAFSTYATEMAISPNKKFVAFVEFWVVYVAPYNQGVNGASMNVTARLPNPSPHVQACTYTGGQYLQWSYDSSTLFWAWGPNLYELTVPDLEKCQSNSCITENLKTYNVSVTVPTEVPSQDQFVVFDNATLLTMVEDGDIIENGRLVVQGDRIYDMGPRDNVTIPPNSQVFDLAGGYVMPGFIDSHAHWSGSWDSNFKVMADWEMMVNLAFGVTTMHNPSADTLSVFADAELIRAGKKIGPRIFSTGKIIYGAGGSEHCDISSLDDARNYLLAIQGAGGWSAKSYNQPTRTARQMILEAARELQMNVVPEGGMTFSWNLNQIIDGHTTIEHSIPIAPLYNDVITLFAESGTAWTPTLIVNYGGIWGERYWYQHQTPWANERLLMYVPEDVVFPITIRYVGAEDEDYHQFATSNSVAQVYKKGGIVEAGAHGEMQGIGIHWEMLMFNQSGILSPYEVLMTATINSALALGLDQEVGSLQIGKLADLIFYNSTNNPLETLDTSSLYQVMKNGKLYNAPSLDEVFPNQKASPPLPQLNTPSKV